MKVTLVSLTQPLIKGPVDRNLSPEEFIVYCARVSNPKNQLNTDTAPKLIKYCLEHSHVSIFEQVSMGVEIVTSRAIAQQIIRHRSFSFQEFSQRYSSVVEAEPVHLRMQAKSNRQSSTVEVVDLEALQIATESIERSFEDYEKLLAKGVARETARFVLPLCAQTTLYMHGTVRSWLTFLNVRLDPHTQAEHRDIAVEIANIMVEHFPVITDSLDTYGKYQGGFL